MRKRKAEIVRPDRRIGAQIETLAYLFDVSQTTVERAVAAGRLKPSSEVFGVKLYHVNSVEKAIFGLQEDEKAAPSGDQPPSDGDEAGDPAKDALDEYLRSQGKGARHGRAA